MPPRNHIYASDVVIDLRAFNAFKNSVTAKDPGTILGKSLENSAKRLAEWMRRRFISLAGSGGTNEWPDIEESTKRRKQSDQILRESDTLLNGIGYAKEGSTGYWAAGYVQDKAFDNHPRFPGTVADLATLLQGGIKNGKSWLIITDPPAEIREEITEIIDGAMRLTIRESNRKARSG